MRSGQKRQGPIVYAAKYGTSHLKKVDLNPVIGAGELKAGADMSIGQIVWSIRGMNNEWEPPSKAQLAQIKHLAQDAVERQCGDKAEILYDASVWSQDLKQWMYTFTVGKMHKAYRF